MKNFSDKLPRKGETILIYKDEKYQFPLKVAKASYINGYGVINDTGGAAYVLDSRYSWKYKRIQELGKTVISNDNALSLIKKDGWKMITPNDYWNAKTGELIELSTGLYDQLVKDMAIISKPKLK